jgi:RNA polymerase sigma-70 factor, ECF subfamily
MRSSSFVHSGALIRSRNEEAALDAGDTTLLDANFLASSAVMSPDARGWVAGFHAGDRRVLEQCYRDHYRAVVGAVARLLMGADAETVTHEVFYRLLWNAKLRENFQGGSFDAWLTQVATNLARDHLRRYRREQSEPEATPDEGGRSSRGVADEVEAKITIDRFRRACLPAEWEGVFNARFLRQLSQRDAAKELGMHRTTLVYQEQRIRTLLKEFLLRGESS